MNQNKLIFFISSLIFKGFGFLVSIVFITLFSGCNTNATDTISLAGEWQVKLDSAEPSDEFQTTQMGALFGAKIRKCTGQGVQESAYVSRTSLPTDKAEGERKRRPARASRCSSAAAARAIGAQWTLLT